MMNYARAFLINKARQFYGLEKKIILNNHGFNLQDNFVMALYEAFFSAFGSKHRDTKWSYPIIIYHCFTLTPVANPAKHCILYTNFYERIGFSSTLHFSKLNIFFAKL